jgi:CO dehydrogenase maturation factor
MKIAVTGKGGVGKTTLASLLARLYAADGYNVLAIDADPDANLATALGFPRAIAERITPIADMKDLVEERTGMRPGTSGGFFTLNPRVDDIPDTLAASYNGVRLLVMGTVKKGGAGCVCGENTLIKSLVRHLLVERKDVVIMDMVAGVEHLGRGTAAAVDALLVVVEPGQRSMETARTVVRLAADLGIKRIYAVGCKVRSDRDRQLIAEGLPGMAILGYLPYSELAVEADLAGKSTFDVAPDMVEAARTIKARLDELEGLKGQ